MNIAVIGSNGFIGRNLAEELKKIPGNNLFLFGRSKTSAVAGNLPYAQIDLCDREKIKYQFSEIDLVYYLASESIPATTWEKPLLEIELNLVPFITFVECIQALKVKKLAFVSSAGTIYGPSDEKVAEDANKNPFSPYGITKLTMEFYLNYFRRKYNMAYDIYRVSNVYGIGQDTSKGLGIINTFLEKIVTEGRIEIFGDGENTRNYVYIEDVGRMMSLSCTSDINSSRIFNASSDDTLSINQLVKIMGKVVAEKFEITYRETRSSDNSKILLDNSRIKKAIPGLRLTSIEEGIQKTYIHIKQQVTK